MYFDGQFIHYNLLFGLQFFYDGFVEFSLFLLETNELLDFVIVGSLVGELHDGNAAVELVEVRFHFVFSNVGHQTVDPNSHFIVGGESEESNHFGLV